MDFKRILGLSLCTIAFALIVWGLFFTKLPFPVSIKIDLPQAERDKPKYAPIEVEILSNGALRVEGAPSTMDNLPGDIAAKASFPPDAQEIRIRAAGNVDYKTFTAVRARVNGSGWTKVGMVASGESTR